MEMLLFTKITPDKGTETYNPPKIKLFYYCLQRLPPIRGRKPTYVCSICFLIRGFTKITPDKGTETRSESTEDVKLSSLQRLTPIRGRKL